MKNKKWTLAKYALIVGYSLILLIYVGMILDLILTDSISEMWLEMFRIDLLFIAGILTQFGAFNHLDKRLFTGGNDGKTNNISADNSGVDS